MTKEKEVFKLDSWSLEEDSRINDVYRLKVVSPEGHDSILVDKRELLELKLFLEGLESSGVLNV